MGIESLTQSGIPAAAAADLVTVGAGTSDAALRQLLHGLPGVDFADVTGYFPGRVAALRTLKSDVVTGLDPAVVAGLDATGQPWRTNGEHGLIQVRP